MPSLFPGPGTRPGPDTVTQQQLLAHGFHHVVPAGTTVYSSVFRTFWADHNDINFTNHGTLWNISATEAGAVLAGFYILEFYNYGLIVQETTNGNATGVFVGSHGYHFENRGEIYALARGNAAGVEHWWPDLYLVNSGLIAAYSSGPSNRPDGGGGVGSAIGIALFNGGGIRNEADGAILAEGLYARALLMANGEVANYGRIEALSTDPGQTAYGIMMGGSDFDQNQLFNAGLIRADIAWSSDEPHPVYGPRGADHVINLASGRIEGDIETGRGDDEVINEGTLIGDVRLGEAADLFDASRGTWTGVADLGWDDDRFIGSTAGDTARGNRGRDRLDGGLGNDLLLGGAGADRLAGEAGNDGLYGESGDDVLILAGADNAHGGDGDDRIEASDLSFAFASGGAGRDTFYADIAGLKLDLSAIAASGRVQSIERIELRDTQQIAVRAGDVAALAGATLEIAGTRYNQVILAGAWVEQRAVVQEGGVFRAFTLGGETVLVRMGVSVTTGAIPAGFTGLDAVAGGAAAPQAGAVPGGTLSSPVLDISYRSIQERYTLIEEDETWQAFNLPVAAGGSAQAVLENRGVMSVTTAGANSLVATILLGDFGLIINSGTIRAAATDATSGTAALAHSGRGRVENYGVIEAVATGGSVSAARAGSSGFSPGAALINHGTIRAETVTGTATGVTIVESQAFDRTPIVANFGLIEAVGGAGTMAVQFTLGGLLVNRGDIVARNSASSGAQDAIGIILSSTPFNGSDVDNLGTISGIVAIQAFNTRSAIRNSGLIAGDIRLSGGSDLLDNAGEIRGAVRLGAGSDLYVAINGIHQGAVSGEDGGDALFGTGTADILDGGADDDIIFGGGGADTLSGGGGRDIFLYRRVEDSVGPAIDTIADFTSGTDRIDLTALNVQSVTIQADGGFSILNAVTAAGTLSIRVSGALSQADLVLSGQPSSEGTSGADSLLASAGGSSLNGGDGHDLLVGLAGNDRLDGGAGSNVMWGGAGDDVYVVRSVGDQVSERPGEGVDVIEYFVPFARMFLPDHVENAVALTDSLLVGNALANRITGSAGNDNLSGGDGDDVLFGGSGADWLYGNGGADRLTGGTGADLFIYWAVTDSRDRHPRSDGAKVPVDVITDFQPGEDRIDLSDFDANPAGGGSNDAFAFLGAGAFTGHAGQLRTAFANGVANIYADLDGDRVADLQIVALTPAALQIADFIL